jgi:hypothetical protein
LRRFVRAFVRLASARLLKFRSSREARALRFGVNCVKYFETEAVLRDEKHRDASAQDFAVNLFQPLVKIELLSIRGVRNRALASARSDDCFAREFGQSLAARELFFLDALRDFFWEPEVDLAVCFVRHFRLHLLFFKFSYLREF